MESMANEGQERVRREREQTEAQQQALSHRMYHRFGIQTGTTQAPRSGDATVRCSSAPGADGAATPRAGAAAGGATASGAPQPLQQQPPQRTPRQPLSALSHGAAWNMQERPGLPGPVCPLTRREKAEQRWEVLFGSSCPLKPRTSKGVPNLGTSAAWQGLMIGAAWEPVKRTPRIEPVSAIMYGPDAAMRRDIIHGSTRSAKLASESMMEEEEELA